MAKLSAILPKLGVFLVATIVGASIAYVVAAAANRPQLEPTAGTAPEYVLTAENGAGPGQIAAFDLIDAQQDPTLITGISDDDLGAASEALLDDSPPPGTTPLGFPRVPLVSQFDGGPFQNANCTLASGAMLARLAFGIVTSGSILRTLQFDQDGGTDLHDLNTAVFRGYGVKFNLGALLPDQMMALSLKGYGIVIQGNTKALNAKVRFGSFQGPHAVYIDGAWEGDADSPAAYWVIDPQGRGNYNGGWWPADEVEKFARSFSGSDRIAAAWAFPPGGVPPEVVPPDLPPLPGGEPEDSPPPAAASPTPIPSGGLDEGVEPGDEPETPPPVVGDPPVLEPTEVGGVDVDPDLTVCLVDPPPDGCPDGIEGVFDKDPPILQIDFGPDIEVIGVDSSAFNVALVAFRIDHPAPVDVKYWQSDGSPPVITGASSIAALDIGGQPGFVARLDVLAGTEYHFQVAAGDGLFVSTSDVGTFTTGSGVSAFEVTLASNASPKFGTVTGFTPYLQLAPDSVAPPLMKFTDVTPDICLIVIDFGGDDYCETKEPPPDAACVSAHVTYELQGITNTSVLVTAFPTESGVSDGAPTVDGILEAEGPADTGAVTVGCLASGLTYTIALQAIGHDGGILASKQVDVP